MVSFPKSRFADILLGGGIIRTGLSNSHRHLTSMAGTLHLCLHPKCYVIPVSFNKFLRVGPNVVRTEKSNLDCEIVGEVLLNMSFTSLKMRHVIQHLRHGLVSALCGPGDQTDDLHERRRHQGLARSQRTQEVGAFVRRHTFFSDRQRYKKNRVESRMAYLRATYHSRHYQPSSDRFTNTVRRGGVPLAVENVSFDQDDHKRHMKPN